MAKSPAPVSDRSVAIFRETRNGVRPISGAKNQATAVALGDPRSSCVHPGAHSARHQDSRDGWLDAVSHGLAFRLRRRSRAALRRNARPYGYAGVDVLNHEDPHSPWPRFAGFRDWVVDTIGAPDWADRIRDCFGLAHLNPEPDRPIPIALMRYPVHEVLRATRDKTQITHPICVPTVLDHQCHRLFFPHPARAAPLLSTICQ